MRRVGGRGRAGGGIAVVRRRWLVAALLVAAGSAPARAGGQVAPSATGTVSGVVRDAAGGGLAGVELELVGRARRERSDAQGRFRFSAVPVGAAQLAARRLGFRPGSGDATVRADSESSVVIELTPTAQSLAPMVVRERREVYDARLEGFYARQQRGVGHFIGRDRIAQANSASFTDILRAEVPGVKIGLLGDMTKSVRLRGSRCPPLVFLDGFPATAGEFDVDMLEVGSLEGIEVYGSLASVPPEFMGPGMLDRCGVIAVWTRPTESRARRAPRAGRAAGSAADTAGASPQGLEQLVARGEVFTAADVEVRAQLDSGSFAPDFPDSLYRAGAGGRVTAEFVVDSAGAVEGGSLRIVSSTDPRFDGSVKAALLDARFVPARRGGRAVRQLVQFPVLFEPNGSPSRSAPPGASEQQPGHARATRRPAGPEATRSLRPPA